ncbi:MULTISPECIES: S1 family peptidase [Streptomyces]|uniref:Putative secreted serine protease n=1 Tax=Streptomyces albus (strain ATCC 21838 / DSM 41398 / FERM P-419 / JCM 4703 / NBRC 107858) TaxID=1081613 RepID=A0A0B5F2W7_STRA4|nr:S1 family peptidase [Streptomyces sp. SCSIO ZS0520]AJE85241.1 putative secreted serine protease [Streptomyces albus]AOU79548.1 putative secreted serine protease [Streptomyces albus]
MRRSLSLRWALPVTLALTASAAVLQPAVASGADPAPRPAQRAESVSPGMLGALKKDFGLSTGEARTRLRQEAAATALAPEAEKAAGSAFGGSWYDSARGTLVVGLTKAGARADAAPAKAVRALGAEVRETAHTARYLDSVKGRLDSASRSGKAPSAVHSWRTDPRTGAVVADVARGAEDRAEVKRFLAPAEKAGVLKVRTTDAARPLAAGTVGGDPYYINGNTRCSIGFSVVGGFVSAGHCGGQGSSVTGWDGSAMGTFAGSSFPGNDYAFVQIGNGWWTEPVVLGWGTVGDVLVRGSGEAPVGASICRSGSTTHWHCGTVQSKNDTVNYSQGAVYEMTGTSVCAEPGDSGGSFVSGDQAQGVTSGGSGNCSSGGQTWFQPVNEILSTYGLTLVTA